MTSNKENFAGKKITIMGLGLLGRGIGDAIFFAEAGADVLVTDLKTEKDLESSIKQLEGYKNVSFVLGEHRLSDFEDRDLILKAAGVPLDSPFIEHARNRSIPIEMDASLFARLAGEGVMIIGVTGTRGKTTTTSLIYQLIQKYFVGGPHNVFLGGNIRGMATLPLIDKVKEGDIVVMELDSWQLQGFGESKISPHISVFTNFMNDHLNYYKGDLDKYLHDKAKIFLNQKKDDYLVVLPTTLKFLTEHYPNDISGQVVAASANDVSDFNLIIPGGHNRENVSLAVSVAKILGIPSGVIKEVVEGFKGVDGRLQFITVYQGVKIYNDTTATTPEATLVGLRALDQGKKNTILIMGGADKILDMTALEKALPDFCQHVVLLDGTGTAKLKLVEQENFKLHNTKTLKEAFEKALELAKSGDTLLFSPAFASFGLFKNEYDRGDQFLKLVENLVKDYPSVTF